MTSTDNVEYSHWQSGAAGRSIVNLEVEIQPVTQATALPAEDDFIRWVQAALVAPRNRTELVIRLVDEAESRRLNLQYRGLDRPTNVLSFPFEPPSEVASALLGDLVICAPVVSEEARQQGKPDLAHWAHMVVHGVLHLQGYDHQTDPEAERMEALERTILQQLHFPDPYHEEDP
ncbi:MAG: rRNA maturation RNase YbeY [Gammaproteobacteria bacterium]|nr:rRNA maturation RNase YbeY [Gammaproteobacteria bacterium]